MTTRRPTPDALSPDSILCGLHQTATDSWPAVFDSAGTPEGGYFPINGEKFST